LEAPPRHLAEHRTDCTDCSADRPDPQCDGCLPSRVAQVAEVLLRTCGVPRDRTPIGGDVGRTESGDGRGHGKPRALQMQRRVVESLVSRSHEQAAFAMTVQNNFDWNTPAADPAADASAIATAPEPAPVVGDDFMPREPKTLEQAGLTSSDLEALILKILLNCGARSGRMIADQIRLPFSLIDVELQKQKERLSVAYRGSAPMGDYEYELTDRGIEYARRHGASCTYFGAAPVRFQSYLESVRAQSIENAKPRLRDLQRAFSDLQLPPAVISQIGQAVHAGKALFLYGAPGNGKTCIAERVIRAVSETIWIPRCITVTNEIVRLYDPTLHEAAPLEPLSTGEPPKFDRRWVRIRRPTVMTGGELTMDMLETKIDPSTGINEAPLQLKSNGGALVIDDFGRQRMSTTELLNRWIVPLEKGFDYLTLRSGRHIEIPFAQLLVFSTNLDPREIVDEAFLRRIPYKIEVFDPSEEEFRELFIKMAAKQGFDFEDDVITYLLEKHYRKAGRPLRYCHARDLLLQINNLCEFHELARRITPTSIDVAAYNYFAGLSTEHH